MMKVIFIENESYQFYFNLGDPCMVTNYLELTEAVNVMLKNNQNYLHIYGTFLETILKIR